MKTIFPSNLLILFVIVNLVCLGRISESAYAQEQDAPDYTSSIPQYTFPGTLEEEEKALRNNPLIQRFIDSGDARNIGLFLYVREGEGNIQTMEVNELRSE